ncbi:MAG: excinuclease ABC subunit A [Bacteroidetes bacterium HGW-Bacteroidetes-6]|jgi:excinuclease ABC subunit A|nr:MAG: excinuclease ABC subunit A [Bacteroidetes bacterium HGW-Bacteroidetes-6]
MKKPHKIIIKGARVNNLQNVTVEIPAGKLTCITGLSGSGKSSLAFDTLFAEGQRRYVESLSAYARQFLGRMLKPDVDIIEGIAPAIAIEQKTSSRNPRSTVGTVTEIYDYLKLFFARAGSTYSPISGKEVKRHQVKDVVNYVAALPEGSRVYLLAPYILRNERTLAESLALSLQQGYSRIMSDGEIHNIEEWLEKLSKTKKAAKPDNRLFLLIDRMVTVSSEDETSQRFAGSVETAFSEGDDICVVYSDHNNHYEYFSRRFEEDGISFEEPSVNLFSFNNPYGACSKCEGFGSVIGIDPNLVIPDRTLSVYEGAIAPWKGEKMGEWLKDFLDVAWEFDFPVHKPFEDLTEEHQKLVWIGNKKFNGLNAFFKMLEDSTYKIQYRVMLSRYKGRTICPDCRGSRLRIDASYVKINGYSITDMVLMPIRELREVFGNLSLNEYETKVSHHILREIRSRLNFLSDTGLEYLTLNRLSNSLSGGETQRINLARALGSSLVGSMYILDEPSIGLHPVDTERLIQVLKNLRNIGNTVIVVEHDEDIIREADYIIDMGPGAGRNGGHVVFQGNMDELMVNEESHTARFFRGEEMVPSNLTPRKPRYFIELKGLCQNNLQKLDVKIPLNVITAVTGVSGSGKSSLVRQVLYPALRRHFGVFNEQQGEFRELGGDLSLLTGVEMVDQNPIGRSSRSNPATYLKAFDEIRELFSILPLAKQRGYKPGFFSFNVEGGRCDVCEGEGSITVEMQFMADVHLVCEECSGKRYKSDVLDITYNGKHIADILELTVNDALSFFSTGADGKQASLSKRICDRLQPLADVGLGYLQLGQSSSSLSGGEAQRIKLASFLSKAMPGESILFIFDEPTTGLHYHDINYFFESITRLINAGHTVVLVEHNMELVKCADYIIDLGPHGGNRGGKIMYQGPLQGIKNAVESATASVLIKKLNPWEN